MATTAFPRWANDSRGPSMIQTAQALEKQGALVRVIALHAPGAKSREMLNSIDIIRTHYLPERLETLQNQGGGLPAAWNKKGWERLGFPFAASAYTLAMMRYARECDILHAHWTLPAMAARVGCFLHNRPYVVTVHGSDIFQATQTSIIRTATQIALHRAHRVIAVSQALADATMALGISASKIVVIPDGINIERFSPTTSSRERIILFVGSLIERKGINYLLEAFSLIHTILPSYRLVIVGDGPQKESLMRLASQLSIETRVSFVGTQSQDQVRQWMQRAQLFVLPSLEEALGIVILEALASGTPCVGTRVGGIPEILLPSAGILVPPADFQALAHAMRSILEDYQTWQWMSQNARQAAEKNCITWDQVASQLIEIYRSILNA